MSIDLDGVNFSSAEFLDRPRYLDHIERAMTQVRDRISYVFYSFARSLMTPLWTSTSLCLKTVSICQNADAPLYQKIYSIMTSTFASCMLLPFTISGLVLGQIIHFSAFHLASTSYTHFKGRADCKQSVTINKIFQQNCCLTAGGFASLFGGLTLSDEQRIEKLAATIKYLKPDVICLQEVSDLKAARSFCEKLSSEFTDFYFNIGVSPCILKNNSGLFVATKHPIADSQFHSFSTVTGIENMVNKGYFTFSIGEVSVINTHLSPSSNDFVPTQAEIETRAEEQRRIVAEKDEYLKRGQTVLVLGDFNTSQKGPLFKNSIYQSDSQSEEFCCQTDYLVDRNWRHNQHAKPHGIVLDHCLAFSDAPLKIVTQPISAFTVDSPEKAISDHPGLLHQISLLAKDR